MNRLLLASLSVILVNLFGDTEINRTIEKQRLSKKSIPVDLCNLFNDLNTKIRDGVIDKKTAAVGLKDLLKKIKLFYYNNGGRNVAKQDWIFPLQGYTVKATGGTNGNGYTSSGYNFFDGNKHKAHPAYDIFIRDKNQDGIDDFTNKPVNVLSVTAGIVIATENSWNTASELRGGKYILVYDPSSGIFTYYAHNNEVLINLCDLVKPGDVIATVGRTGYNAFKKRSPTHLHVMQLQLDSNYYPKPLQFYSDLTRMKTLK